MPSDANGTMPSSDLPNKIIESEALGSVMPANPISSAAGMQEDEAKLQSASPTNDQEAGNDTADMLNLQ